MTHFFIGSCTAECDRLSGSERKEVKRTVGQLPV